MIKLLKVLCGLGAPISLPASDEILCTDIDQLRDLDPRERLPRLRKAKREALCLHLENHVTAISDAAGRDQVLADMLLGGFIGSDDPSTPYSHATLYQSFYGKPLSAEQITRWTCRAMHAARRVPFPDQAASTVRLPAASITLRRRMVSAGGRTNFPAPVGGRQLHSHPSLA